MSLLILTHLPPQQTRPSVHAGEHAPPSVGAPPAPPLPETPPPPPAEPPAPPAPALPPPLVAPASPPPLSRPPGPVPPAPLAIDPEAPPTADDPAPPVVEVCVPAAPVDNDPSFTGPASVASVDSLSPHAISQTADAKRTRSKGLRRDVVRKVHLVPAAQASYTPMRPLPQDGGFKCVWRETHATSVSRMCQRVPMCQAKRRGSAPPASRSRETTRCC